MLVPKKKEKKKEEKKEEEEGYENRRTAALRSPTVLSANMWSLRSKLVYPKIKAWRDSAIRALQLHRALTHSSYYTGLLVEVVKKWAKDMDPTSTFGGPPTS